MLRQNDPVLHDVDKSFWEYVEKMDGGRKRCRFCGDDFAKDIAITRFKFHFAGVKGRGIRICGKVPQDVQDAALAAIDGPPEKKLKTGAGSSNNEVTNAISASAQQQNTEMTIEHQQNNEISLEDWMASITVEDMDPLQTGSFHERPSFNQANEPRGDPSQPTNDQLCSLSVNNDVIMNDAQQRETIFTGEYEWENDFFGGGIELGRYTPETNPITEQANPETDFARDHCSPVELLHGEFQTLPRTEPVVQVLEQSNAERDNLSVDAGRTQVGVQGMEQGGEEGRVCLHLDMENTSEGLVQPNVGAIVPPTIDENDNRREATERLVQPNVGASSFVVYGNHNAISSQQEQNNEVNNVVGDAGKTPAAETMDHAPGSNVQEYMRSLEACLLEDGIDNGTGVVQPGAGASSFGGLTGNTNEIKGDALPTRKLVGQAFEDNKKFIWSLLMGDEVSSIGIYGMGGVGKTALVTHLYNQLLERPQTCVYWITASKDTSINRLQTSLARRIGLDLSNEDDEMHRVVLLKKKLMKKQHKWVLILDDLWKAFDLQKLGIPDQAEGCKLILTTRSEKICQQMKTQHAIKVQPEEVLQNCTKLRHVPSLEKLTALKKLDLTRTALEKMPQGMECLRNLEYLAMNGCGEREFPSGLLLKLSHLQALVLEEELIDGRYAPITIKGKEVGCLRKLESLKCHFEGHSDFAEYLKSRDETQSLSTYCIWVGHPTRIQDYDVRTSKTIALINLSGEDLSGEDFQVMFPKDIQQLIIDRCHDATSLCDVFSLINYATELEDIVITHCNSMESLVSSSWFCSALSLNDDQWEERD